MHIDIIQQKDNSTWNYLLGVRENEVRTGSGTTLYSTGVAFDKLNKWHRFEAVITLGWRNGNATYYFDGVQVGTGTTKNALNHIMIQTPGGSGKGTFYVDNLVIKEPGKLTAKVSGSPDNIGDSLEIEFSDSVESFELADVSLVNTETNKSIELKSVERISATTYKVSVNEKLENNGEYGVVISKNVKSAVSGAYCGDVLRLNAGGTRVGGFVKGVTVIGSDGKPVNDTTVAPAGSTMVVLFSDDTVSDAANSIFVNGENANGVWNDNTKEYVLTVPEYQNNAMELSVTDKYMDRAYDEESFTYSFRIKDVLQQNAEYYVYIPSTVLEANGTVSLGKNISCKINTAYGYNKIEQPYMTELDENTVEFGVKIYNYEQGEDVYTFAKATYGTDNSFDLEADEIDLTTTPGKAVWYTVDKTKLDRGTKIKTFLFESAANIKPVYECNEYLIQ